MAKARLLCYVAVLAAIAHVAHAVALQRLIGVNDAATDPWLWPMAVGSVRNGVGAGTLRQSQTSSQEDLLYFFFTFFCHSCLFICENVVKHKKQQGKNKKEMKSLICYTFFFIPYLGSPPRSSSRPSPRPNNSACTVDRIARSFNTLEIST